VAKRRGEPGSSAGREGTFATTHWSLVAAAGRSSSPEASSALAMLCKTYWYPLYAFVRRKGADPHDAQDLTQEFFAWLLARRNLRAADRQRGKFRTFLLAALQNFLANQWRKGRAQKRGGGHSPLPLDFRSGEERYIREPVHELTAEKVFERRWALTLLDEAVSKLRMEYASAGKEDLFQALKGVLGGESPTAPYSETAPQLGVSEGALKTAAHRLRRRCRELLRAEIAQTVTGPDEIDEELRELFAAVGA
jgi:RNA polymerase sigma-70 factor (ECF subfamily)